MVLSRSINASGRAALLQRVAVIVATCFLASPVFTGIKPTHLWDTPAADDPSCFNKVFKNLQLLMKSQLKGGDLCDRHKGSVGLTNTPGWLCWLIFLIIYFAGFGSSDGSNLLPGGGRMERGCRGGQRDSPPPNPPSVVPREDGDAHSAPAAHLLPVASPGEIISSSPSEEKKHPWPHSSPQQITFVLPINLAFCSACSTCVISSRKTEMLFQKTLKRPKEALQQALPSAPLSPSLL